MKTIVAGSRDVQSIAVVRYALSHCPWAVTEVVSGTARGVDQLGEKVAKELGLPVQRFPADWSLGGMAGHARNVRMAHYAEGLIAVWDGHSPGTKHMIDTAKQRGLNVVVFHPQEIEKILAASEHTKLHNTQIKTQNPSRPTRPRFS